jgi:hypothetical protein
VLKGAQGTRGEQGYLAHFLKNSQDPTVGPYLGSYGGEGGGGAGCFEDVWCTGVTRS